MTRDIRYEAVEGEPPEPPELVEPEGVSADNTAAEVGEMNRKLDLILQALGVEEEK